MQYQNLPSESPPAGSSHPLRSPISHKTSRKYGSSCLACRRRKVRCDGVKPACHGCARSGVQCTYNDAAPSLSRLTNALERSEARIAELQQALEEANSPRNTSTTSALSPSSIRCSQGQAEQDSECNGRNLSLDENGTVQYYGATSRFHLPQTPTSSQHPYPRAGDQGGDHGRYLPTDPVDEAYHRRWLLSNARFQKSWDRAVLANLRNLATRDSALDMDTDTASTLLQIHWTWQASLHSCVYRRCFTRDMALGDGPYFSPFLLNTIFALACRHARPGDSRFDRFDKGEVFLRRAKMLLMEEMDEERHRIPTIQALLMLGGRQCAIGHNAQGWLYTGMAIQMLKHLGLHLPRSSRAGVLLERLEPDDLEARKRLYFSAYAWDKSISLCLGRPPSLTEMPYPPLSLFDLSDNTDLWYPFYLGDLNDEPQYQPTPGYKTTSFMYFCEQARIINEMYEAIYNRRPEHVDHSMVIRLEDKFRSFYRSLPDHIRVDTVNSLPCCPPPHIFALNILYHTCLILLYRPFFLTTWNSSEAESNSNRHSLFPRARHVCTEEAAKVNAFFRAYGRTYRYRNQTYLTSYCVYTAATIEVQQIHHSDRCVSSQAKDRLATTLRMLEVESQQTPGIRRSVDIIKAQLGETEEPTSMTAAVRPEPGPGQGLVPGVSQDSSSSVHITRQEMTPETTPLPASLLAGISGVPGEDSLGSLQPIATEGGTDGLLGTAWLDWYLPNAGGGFVPDVNSWDMG